MKHASSIVTCLAVACLSMTGCVGSFLPRGDAPEPYDEPQAFQQRQQQPPQQPVQRQPSQNRPVAYQQYPQQRAALQQNMPRYGVSFIPKGGKPDRHEQILDRPITVGDAVKRLNGYNKFTACKVSLVRTSPTTGQRHKMDVRLEKKGVNPAFDYALRPDDHVMVFEDTTSPVDHMLDRLSPL